MTLMRNVLVKLLGRLRRPLVASAIVALAAACATPVDQQARVQSYAMENPATQPQIADNSLLRDAHVKRGAYTHYVEFRSRYALSYGHTFLVHGQLKGGHIASKEVAGLHPAGDDPSHWVLGHFVPVKSETGASDGDTEDEYISARYRINLTATQYAEVSRFIRNLQASSPVWHAVWYNCNAFVADVARFMGLQTPGTLELPTDFINGIRRLNGGRARIDGLDGKRADAMIREPAN